MSAWQCRNVLHRLQVAAAALSFCAIVGSAKAEEITLKSAVFVPPSTTYGIPFKRFVDHVNETGKGVLQIRIVGGPEAVPADGQAQAVKNGVLDIAAIPPAYYKSAMVEGDAQILSNMTVAEQRKSGGYAALNAIAGERMNSMYLTTYGIGVPFHFYVTKEMAITKPEDLSGLRFRGQPNYNALFKHYGIAGVNIAAPEVYTALERGTVQGYGWPLWGINDFGWEKLTKVRIDPGFYNVVNTVLMNKSKYASLTPEQKKVIDDAVVWFEQDDLRYTAEKTKETLELQAKAGIKTVDFGPEFKKLAVSLYWDDLKKLSPDAMAKLQPLLTK
ncbi:TRAP transporter substrate-binding protein DctP [Rhodoplanes sp. Z2-YC6860]|uniref:TRAP transporter substrate-binding protein DctP n=1 Tax=Rhodoplanes sp. Z2-YC6860 TaxID=674703 RepID=UPI00078E083B|nr:TRAP transporter substrate-binding protein DctP [Rhodoplanes sp. Z2-YC6860]AMN40665.1 TRAP dicarboxylate transporter, DctP subunit, putative [Rhodoplanes sp. Z2-YC6860]